jgi:acyl carrier protein
MQNEAIEARVYRIVSQLFDVPASNLSPSSSPATIESWDSMGHLNLVLALEEEFGIKLPPERMDAIADVRCILLLVTEAELGNS